MTILWDWNGTLLDDVDAVVALTDRCFRQYGYGAVDRETYIRLFRFPIRDYYRDMGITDDDEFERVANAWSRDYVAAQADAPLRRDALPVLERFRAAGFRQVVISASEISQLHQQMAYHPGLKDYFDDIRGLGDIYAASKVQLARDYLAENGLNPSEAVFLGDTDHDAEVAKAIGVRCILIRNGHQHEDTLHRTGAELADSLTDAAALLLK